MQKLAQSGTLTRPPHVCFISSETVAKTGMILLAGEITSRAHVDYQKIVRETIKHVGYDDSSKGTESWAGLQGWLWGLRLKVVSARPKH